MKLKKIIKSFLNHKVVLGTDPVSPPKKEAFRQNICVSGLINQEPVKGSCTTSGDCIASRLAKEVASQTNRTADYDCSGLANRNPTTAEVDWPSLFDLVNQKGRRAFFVPLDQIQQKTDLCENCISSVFSNDIDFESRGWFCWWRLWDNRGEYESPVHYPTGKGLHSSCKLFSAVLREDI